MIRSFPRSLHALLLATVCTASALTPLAAQGVRRGLDPRPSSNTAGGFGTYHAVIFAVGEQQAGTGLPSLKYPLKEADSLRAVLTREYTFDANHVQLVRNPTREAILDTLEVLARRLGPEDNLLVVYSGHGGFDEGGREGYWLATDAANARPSTWIPNESIRTWLRKLKARSVLLITDACFSGSLNRSNDDRVDLPSDAQRAIAGALMYARRSSRQAMTAGTAKETVPQVSVFSMEIVAALKHRQAPVFLAQQLAAEINPRVAAVAHTTPTFSAVPGIESDQGDFVFVRRPTADAVATVATATPAVTPNTGVQRGATTATPAVTTPVATSRTGTRANNTTAAPATVSRAPTVRAAPTCDGGVASGCVMQGLNAELGRAGSTKDPTRAVGFFRTACDVGDPEGCANLGRMYDAGRGVAVDRAKARSFFATACDGGAWAGCTYLGLAAAKGEGTTKDEARAVAYYTQGCTGGHAMGCGLLGTALAAGRGVARDEARAVAAYTQGCNANDPGACNGLGVMLAGARGGVTRDEARAAVLYRQSCEAGFAEACANLGSAHMAGRGLVKDDVKAVAMWSQACESGFAGGCTLLASAYENGTSATPRSDTRAQALYRRACDAGDARACAYFKGKNK